MNEHEKYIDEMVDAVIEYVAREKEKEKENEMARENRVESKVNHPSHYNKGIETIDYIESWSMNFNIGNVIKYVTRAGHKDNKLEDLEKAKWYLEREISKAKGNI